MKLIILPLVLASVCLLGAHALHEHSEAQKVVAKQHRLACIEETGVSSDEVAEVNKRNFDKPSDLIKKFTLCYFKKYGIIGADNSFNLDSALAERPPGSDKEDVKKALGICKDIKGDKAEDLFDMFKCYHTTLKEPQVVFF